jgi:hypothetical protein
LLRSGPEKNACILDQAVPGPPFAMTKWVFLENFCFDAIALASVGIIFRISAHIQLPAHFRLILDPAWNVFQQAAQNAKALMNAENKTLQIFSIHLISGK